MNGFNLNKEHHLSRIDISYSKLWTDFVVRIKNKKFAPPLLFVEHSRDHELNMGFTLVSPRFWAWIGIRRWNSFRSWEFMESWVAPQPLTFVWCIQFYKIRINPTLILFLITRKLNWDFKSWNVTQFQSINVFF